MVLVDVSRAHYSSIVESLAPGLKAYELVGLWVVRVVV